MKINNIFPYLLFFIFIFWFTDVYAQNKITDSVYINNGYEEYLLGHTNSAVQKIDSDELNFGSSNDLVKLLLGRITGASVISDGNNPSENYKLQLRGGASIYSKQEPLYIIDGIIDANPDMISVHDIQSINIFRDASSTAIYGSRGANGVVVIETKQDNSGKKLMIELNSSVSADWIAKKYDLFSVDEFRKLASQYNLSFTDNLANTDWQNELYRTAFSQYYNLALSGKNKYFSYRVSGSLISNPGTIMNTGKNQKIVSINLNRNSENGKLHFNTFFSGHQSENNYFTDREDLLKNLLTHNPTDSVYSADGSGYSNYDRTYKYLNPIALSNYVKSGSQQSEITGKMALKYDITEAFKFSLHFDITKRNSDEFYQKPADITFTELNLYNENKKMNSITSNLNGLVSYNKKFNQNHKVSAFAGYSITANDTEFKNSINSQGTYSEIKADSSYTIQSLFGSISYNYKEKYFLKASTRTDGKYGFKQGNTGFYPSVSAAWDIKKEFFSTSDFIKETRIRAGFGISGNNFHSVFINNITDSLPLFPERMDEINVGLDLSLFKGRIKISGDFFLRHLYDLVATLIVPSPPNPAPYITSNGGRVRNTGFDLSVAALILDRDKIKWTSNFSIIMQKKIFYTITSNSGYFFINRAGYLSYLASNRYIQLVVPACGPGQFYLPVYYGVDASGHYLFEDYYGNPTNDVNAARSDYGGSAIPYTEMNWTNTINFRNKLVINIVSTAVIGHRIYNATLMTLSEQNYFPMLNGDRIIEEKLAQGIQDYNRISDAFLENASYFRLEQISVSYQFKLIKLSIFADNLLTITGYKGQNPDVVNYNHTLGIDNFNRYPKTKTFGLSLNFKL